MPRNFVLASLAVLLVQGNAQEEEGSEVSCLMQSRTPQAATASRAMKSPALVDVPDPDLVTPRGGDDFSAYDKDGALEGHPMFGAEWSPKPKDQIMNPVSDLQDHIDPLIWEEHEKIQRWPVYKHGVSCDTSLVKQIYLAESRSDCNTMTLVGKYQFFMWTDASVDACYDDACREKSGFPMKKKKRNGKSFYYPKRCWMFDECKIVENEKASSEYDIGSSTEWDVYTDPEMYPVHAQEQLCGKVQLENVMGAKPIDTFFDTQVNSMGECQDAATRKGHQFFAVKHETFWRCSSLKSCDKEGSKDPGWMSYEKNEEPPLKKSDSQSMVFRPFKKMANKVCDCRKKNCKNEYVAFGSPEHCWRAPIRCYWNREKPCQVEASYWTQSPPQKFLQCITFETCDAKLRTQAPGWSVHRAAKALWPTSECKGLGGSVDKGIDLTGHAEALSICQDLAVKLGHKFFQLAGSICSSSNTCGQAVLKAIVHEQPRDSETHVSCESEQKIGNYLTSLMNERMPKPTKEHPGGIPASYTWRARAVIFRGLFHDAQDFNRLELQNRESGDFERMDPAEVGDYGGLDGCLYEPTQIGIKMRNFKFDGKYELRDDVGREWANFNVQRRALNIDPMRIDRSHLHASEVACTHFCCDSSSPLGEEEREGLCGASGCRLDAHVTYLDRCMVDMTTFLGNIIIKDAKGPEVVMSWGRRQADCRNMFSHKEIPQKYEPRRIGLHAAGLNFENAGHGVFQDFALMGFDEEGFAALMGAHSFGRLHKYSGDLVLRDTTRGFCNKPEMIQPPIRSTDMRSDDIIYRRDDCQRSDGSTCWKLDTDTYLGDQLKPKLDPDLNQEALDKMAKKGEVPDDGWGMGGFWDLTPDVMDNEYFKMLATEELSQTNICCGEWRPDYHGCYKKGEMQDKQNNSVNPCDIDWCQRDARAMTATKMQFNGQRLWRLASDWSLLMLPKTLDAVKKFAQDEGAFHASFKAAWSKVISNGYSSGRLRQCTIERG